MNKLICSIMFALVMFSFVSAAQDSLGTYTKNQPIELLQICGTCTYNNITSIIYPNSTHQIIDGSMTKRGAEYNYTFTETDLIGNYLVNGVGDLDGTATAWAYEFDVTSSGQDSSGLQSLGIILIMALISAALFASANFFNKEQVAIKTLLIMFGYGFLIIAAQVAKISVGGNRWLDSLSSVGVTMMIVIFWIMIVYYFVIYTKVILNKLKNFNKSKEEDRYGGGLA